MYAMLDYDKKTVIACIPPTVDLTLTEIKEEVNGRILIKVTLENIKSMFLKVNKEINVNF